MNIKYFKELSTRTAPFNANPKNMVEYWNVLGNYSSGLVGEYLEYELELYKVNINDKEDVPEDILNKVESEVGDVMHYAVNLLTIIGEEFDESSLKEDVTVIQVTEALKDILELQKKYIYHGHEFQKEKFIDAVYVIVSSFNNIYGEMLGFILEKNIEKLKVRYPEKFTVKDSIARVDTK